MGVLVLVNDLPTTLFNEGFLVGQLDPEPTEEGLKYAPQIGRMINENVGHLTDITASDAKRVSALVHHIRVNSNDRSLLSHQVRHTQSLRERSFGVLDGVYWNSLQSDMFSHSRMTAEGGESIAQCRDRVIGYLSNINDSWRGVVVSHPFVCQIVSNVVLGRGHTTLTSFWLSPGSFVIFDLKEGYHETQWRFNIGFNAILNRQYTEEKIYSDILGTQRNNPGQKTVGRETVVPLSDAGSP